MINQFKATVTYSSQPLQPQTCVQEHCPGETGLSWSVSRLFRYVSEDARVLNTSYSPQVLILSGFFWKEIMQLVSGKVEFSACQVALLWHNFVVSL